MPPLQERPSCHPLSKIARQQPPSYSTTLFHFILGHKIHYNLKSYIVKYPVVYLFIVSPTKMWISWVQGSLLLISSVKEQWLEHVSMNDRCYILSSMLEIQQWIKQTGSLSSWNSHTNERDKLVNKQNNYKSQCTLLRKQIIKMGK